MVFSQFFLIFALVEAIRKLLAFNFIHHIIPNQDDSFWAFCAPNENVSGMRGLDAVREVVGTAGFYRTYGLQQLRCLYLVKRTFADNGENVGLKTALYIFGMVRHPGMQLFVVPLQRHRLERTLGRKLLAQVCGPALGGWVKISFQLHAQLFTPFPRIAQRDLGKDPNGKRFFTSSLPIPHPPILPAIAINPEVKAVPIVEFSDACPIASSVLAFDSGE